MHHLELCSCLLFLHSRTTRSLFKVASLGLAGLLAGLLSGCNDSPTPPLAPLHHVSTDSFTPDTSEDTRATDLPKSLDATQIPAASPSPVRAEASDRIVSQRLSDDGHDEPQPFLAYRQPIPAVERTEIH